MRKILQYILPVAFTLFMCVNVERTVVTDGGYDRLLGLPLPYMTNNFGCTGCYEVYVLAMIVNLLFFLAIAMGLVKLIDKGGIRLRTHPLGVVVGVIVCLFWVWFFRLVTMDSLFLWTNHTAYQTTYWKLIVGLR